MAFTAADAASADLRSDWWKTRSHHAPLGVQTKEYRTLVRAIEKYEKACAGSMEDPAECLDEIKAAIRSLKGACGQGPDRKMIDLTMKVGASRTRRGVMMEHLPLMGSKTFRDKHQHFFSALDQLDQQCDKYEHGAVPKAYRV